MNIVQIISHSYPSGASRHVLILAAALVQRGHCVTLLCPPDAWLPEQARARGIVVREMPMRSSSAWLKIPAAADALNRCGVDVLHAHTTRGAMLGFLLSLMCRRPVVASVHTHSRDITYRRLIPRGRNRVVAVSNFVREALIARGAPPNYVQTIYNGTDALARSEERKPEYLSRTDLPLSHDEDFSLRAALNLPVEAQCTGVFGYISALKGQELLAQAAPNILAQCPRAHFVFVGPLVSPQIQQRMVEQAICAGIQDRLHFVGYREDVPRLMDAMQVIAVPSEIESLSMVTLEAMARGKCVVATRVGGLPEVIADGETELLVERSPEAFAKAIIPLLQEQEHCARMGQAAQRRVRAQFTAEQMTQQFETLYQSMAGGRAG